MSRARNIKPGFFKNDILAECSATTRLLFIALWCEADREGRLEYRPKRIKPACLPYDDVDIEDAVAELADRGFLSLYESAGAQYIQIVNWAKHQNPHHKEVGSEIPAPPGHIDTVCAGYIPLSNTIRNRIYARDGRVCKECGATHGLSIDHIVPVSRGGNSTNDNLQVLCLGCNVRKGNKFHASSMDEPCMDQASVKQIASCPTDSLIPDSLLLIPDPLQEIPPAVPADAPIKPSKPKGTSGVELQTWIDSLPADQDAIADDDPIFDYADSIGLPADYIALAWAWFKTSMAGKRKKDWRAHFRNAVRNGWPKYWWPTDDGGWRLSPAGEQAKRAMDAQS